MFYFKRLWHIYIYIYIYWYLFFLFLSVHTEHSSGCDSSRWTEPDDNWQPSDHTLHYISGHQQPWYCITHPRINQFPAAEGIIVLTILFYTHTFEHEYINVAKWHRRWKNTPDSKVHGANMGHTCRPQTGPMLSPMNLALRDMNTAHRMTTLWYV